MVELDPERQRQAAEYAGKRRRLGILNFIISVALFALLLLTGSSRSIAESLPSQPAPAAASYLVLLMLGYSLLTLPLSVISGLVLPRRYGLSHQTALNWLADHVKFLTMGIIFGAVAIVVLYVAIENSPDWWWLIAWGLLLAVSLVMTVLAPVLLVPLFFKTHALEEGELKQRLVAVAAKAGVKIGGIYVIEFSSKTSLANAAVMGLGHTKRIVISDTLIEAYTPEEIDMVMAHELAHQHHRDVWRLFGFQAVVFQGFFWLASWLFATLAETQDYVNQIDPAAMPLLLFSFFVAGAFSLPLMSWFSRRLEAAADAFALKLTGNPEVFISAMTKLTNQNLGEARPKNFLERLGQDHPSYVDRVKMAKEHANHTDG
jgi:STE24 endopeptidase